MILKKLFNNFNNKKLFTTLKLGEDYDNLILFNKNEVLDIIFEKNSNVEFYYVDKKKLKSSANLPLSQFNLNYLAYSSVSFSLMVISFLLILMFLEIKNTDQELPVSQNNITLKQNFGLDLILDEIKKGAKK